MFFNKNKKAATLEELLKKIHIKSKLGRKLNRITKAETIVYLVSIFDITVSTHGIEKFFIETQGKYALPTINCLEDINAPHTASILQEAVDAISSATSEDDLPEIDLKLKEIDSKFSENTDSLQIAFCKANNLM